METNTHFCGCGCGTLILMKGKNRRARTYAKGHQMRGRKHSPDALRKMSESQKRSLLSSERQEHLRNLIASNRGRKLPPVSPLSKKGPTNRRSKVGVLRDASGRLWHFKNLLHFVRTHEDLFLPEDVCWKDTKKRDAKFCRASAGLGSLFKKRGIINGTWKGWTVAFSIMERAEGCGDLMARDCSTIPKKVIDEWK